MSTTLAVMKQALYDFAVGSTGQTWVFTKQNAIKPQFPYGYIDALSIRKVGRHQAFQTVITDTDFTEKIENVYEVVYTYGMIADNTFDTEEQIIKLQQSSALSSFHQALYDAGIGVNSWSVIRDISFLEADKILNRHEVDITFNVVFELEQISPLIKTFEVEGEFLT